MKTKKVVITLFLSLCMTLNLGIPAFAVETDPQNSIMDTEITLQEVSKIDESDFHSLVELPEVAMHDFQDEEVSSGSFSMDNLEQFLGEDTLRNAKRIEDMEGMNKTYSKRATPPYAMQTFSDVLPNGTSAKAYFIDSQPGQLLQFSMDVPHNTSLDYDLILFDVTNGVDQATPISVCAYVTNSLFSPEAVGYANRGSTVQNLAIQVQAKGQTSDSDYFTLNVCASLLDGLDRYEPNDSAFVSTECPILNAQQTLNIPGRLNSPIDEDWYVMDFSNAQGFAGVSVTDIPNSVIVESYVAVSNNELSRTGSISGEGTLPIQRGMNYFRVTNKREVTFAPTSYVLNFSPTLQPNQADVIISVNGYCQRSSNEFLDHYYRFLYLMSADVRVKVNYYRDGIPVVDNDDTITVELDDPAWSNPAVRYETSTGSSSSGVYVDLPPIRGDRYDWVYTSVTSSKYGKLMNHLQMANVTKYNGGELGKPCRHNGTCGLK